MLQPCAVEAGGCNPMQWRLEAATLCSGGSMLQPYAVEACDPTCRSRLRPLGCDPMCLPWSRCGGGAAFCAGAHLRAGWLVRPR